MKTNILKNLTEKAKIYVVNKFTPENYVILPKEELNQINSTNEYLTKEVSGLETLVETSKAAYPKDYGFLQDRKKKYSNLVRNLDYHLKKAGITGDGKLIEKISSLVDFYTQNQELKKRYQSLEGELRFSQTELNLNKKRFERYKKGFNGNEELIDQIINHIESLEKEVQRIYSIFPEKLKITKEEIFNKVSNYYLTEFTDEILIDSCMLGETYIEKTIGILERSNVSSISIMEANLNEIFYNGKIYVEDASKLKQAFDNIGTIIPNLPPNLFVEKNLEMHLERVETIIEKRRNEESGLSFIEDKKSAKNASLKGKYIFLRKNDEADLEQIRYMLKMVNLPLAKKRNVRNGILLKINSDRNRSIKFLTADESLKDVIHEINEKYISNGFEIG